MCDYDYTESDIMGAEARQRRRERKDDRFKLDRLRARIREHPADQVPVIEIGELVRILES
jgi:hypothetical protein